MSNKLLGKTETIIKPKTKEDKKKKIKHDFKHIRNMGILWPSSGWVLSLLWPGFSPWWGS